MAIVAPGVALPGAMMPRTCCRRHSSEPLPDRRIVVLSGNEPSAPPQSMVPPSSSNWCGVVIAPWLSLTWQPLLVLLHRNVALLTASAPIWKKIVVPLPPPIVSVPGP